MNQYFCNTCVPNMNNVESDGSLSLSIYGYIFFISIGLPIFLIAWLLDPSYAVPRINGWGLVCFYFAMGFLSIGIFGCLTFLAHHFFRHGNVTKEWQFGLGAFLLAGLTFSSFLILFDPGGMPFFTRKLPFLESIAIVLRSLNS